MDPSPPTSEAPSANDVRSYDIARSSTGLSSRNKARSSLNEPEYKPRSQRSSNSGKDSKRNQRALRVASSYTPLSPLELSELSKHVLYPLASLADLKMYFSIMHQDVSALDMELAKMQNEYLATRGKSVSLLSTTASESTITALDTLRARLLKKNDTVAAKLELEQLMTTKTIALEISALQHTQDLAKDQFVPLQLAGSHVTNHDPRSKALVLSRVASATALSARLMDFHSRLKNSVFADNRQQPSIASPLQPQQSDPEELVEALLQESMGWVEEVEDQTKLLEAELGMAQQPSLHSNSATLVGRLQKIGLALEVVRESGLRHVQDEYDSVKQSNKAISGALRKAREQNEALTKQLTESQSVAETAENEEGGEEKTSNGRTNEENVALLKKLKIRYKQQQKELAASTEKITALEKDNNRQKRIVERFQRTRMNTFEEKTRLEVNYSDKVNELERLELERNTRLQNALATAAKFEQRSETLGVQLATAAVAAEEREAKATQQLALLKSENEMLETRVNLLLEENARLKEGDLSTDDAVAGLEAQLEAVTGQLQSTKRGYEHLEVYYKQLDRQHESDLKSLETDNTKLRKLMADKDSRWDTVIGKLGESLPPGLLDAVGSPSKIELKVEAAPVKNLTATEALRDEMSVMQQTYAMRVSELQALLQREKLQAARASRVFTEQLASEKMKYTRLQQLHRSHVQKYEKEKNKSA